MVLNEKMKPFFGSYFAFFNEKKALVLKLVLIKKECNQHISYKV